MARATCVFSHHVRPAWNLVRRPTSNVSVCPPFRVAHASMHESLVYDRPCLRGPSVCSRSTGETLPLLSEFVPLCHWFLDKVYFRLVRGYWTVEGCLWWNFVRVGQMLQQLKCTFCKFHLINFNGRFCGDKWLISVSLFIMKKTT